MPCFSTITTQLKNGAQIADALRALGFDVRVTENEQSVIGTRPGAGVQFNKRYDGVYSMGGSLSELKSVSRKYAEIGVRRFAQRRGFSITESDGVKMTLVNRRG